MTVLSLFPSRIRFVNPDGTLTTEGYRALQTLYERVGGSLGLAGNDTYTDTLIAGSSQGDAQNTDITVQQASSDFVMSYSDVTQNVSSDSFLEATLAPVQTELVDRFTETTFSPSLPDFQEGLWTPTQGGGLVVVGAFSSSGRYIRIGRQVTVTGVIAGATSVATTAAGLFVAGLPYTIGNSGTGAAINAGNNTTSILVGTVTTLVSSAAIAATPNIIFSFTYMV